MRIALGADHGGYELKDTLISYLKDLGHEVVDYGTHSGDSVDYPDFANPVAADVRDKLVDRGILVCCSGIGVAMAAGRFDGVRAATVRSAGEVEMTRKHNDANVLCFGGHHTGPDEAREMVGLFLSTAFEAGRHERRVTKASGSTLAVVDPDLHSAIEEEAGRQRSHIELIASENFATPGVMEAQGSLLTNKYAEGYPGKRWYGGCEFVDKVETLAIERAKALFGADHANVQPHSGSQANAAVYFAFLKQGDKILTMDLAHGGHLTHGHPANFSGKFYDVTHYGVDTESETIDYDALEATAKELKPKLITSGASAYSRQIDFERMGQIAKEVGALLLVDMAHIAGLVAGGAHPNPVPHADFVTSTTHKSLRGPRGGIILCKAEHAKKIDSMVFPGTQGGPLMHVIAAKAVCFGNALKPEFKEYQAQVVRNAQALAAGLSEQGLRVVSGGTENHVMLVDLRSLDINGAQASDWLDQAAITVNKNAIPFDTGSPFKPSGIRLGTPAVTTRGMKEEDLQQVADFINEALRSGGDAGTLAALRERVADFNRAFPLPR